MVIIIVTYENVVTDNVIPMVDFFFALVTQLLLSKLGGYTGLQE
jgi:hypothetical protein